MKIKNCFLFKEIPCIEIDRGFLFYSPFNNKIVFVQNNSSGFFNYDEIINNLLRGIEVPIKSTYRIEGKKQIAFINTMDCLQRCIYCFNDAGDTKHYLSSDIAIGILNEFLHENSGSILVKFFGGEPTLNVRLLKDVILYFKQKNTKVSFSIVTGGYILPPTLIWMIENNFSFTVSIDGTPKEQSLHRPLIRKNANMLNPEQTIKLLREKNAPFKIRMTVTNENINSLPDLIIYFHSLGAKIVHIEPVNLSGRASKNNIQRPAPEIFTKNLMNAINVASKIGMIIINSSYMNLLDNEECYCSSGKDHFIVGVNGEISLCYELTNDCNPTSNRMLFGKYNTKKGLIEYFGKSEDIKCSTPFHLSSECFSCFAKYVCSGGCPSRNLSDSQSLLNPGGYFCKITKLVLPKILINIAKSANLLENHQ